MRKVIGVPKRDIVIDKGTGERGRVGDIDKKTISSHQKEAETAKAELAKLKAKLGINGIDIDNLPDELPKPKAEEKEELPADNPEIDQKAGKKAEKAGK